MSVTKLAPLIASIEQQGSIDVQTYNQLRKATGQFMNASEAKLIQRLVDGVQAGKISDASGEKDWIVTAFLHREKYPSRVAVFKNAVSSIALWPVMAWGNAGYVAAPMAAVVGAAVGLAVISRD